MRSRPVIVLLLSVALLGCANDAPATDEATTVPPPPSTTLASPDPSDPGGSGVTTTSLPGEVASDPAARAAVDRYLDGIGTNDFPTALGASRDGLQSLALVRSIVHTGNAQRGGTTTSRFEERSLHAVSATADEVRFAGQVTLTSTVSGASGPPQSSTDRFTDIVARRDASGWRAADATYNAAPVISVPASAAADAGPVRVTLTGAVAFGASLAVVVQLVSSGEHAVEVIAEALRIDDEQATSTSSIVVGGQPGFIYLSYPRRDERPSAWSATLLVDGTEHRLDLSF
ncbi:MAG: hypothetical protein ACT452_01585 [Microthrixaceae bacterium]